MNGGEIIGDDGVVYEVVDDDDLDYDEYDDFDEDDFTDEEKAHAMWGAMNDVKAREAQQYEDEEYDDSDDFQDALLFDLQRIANTLGRSMTNREVNAAIEYAEATGNAPSEALDQLGIKQLDLNNDSDRTEHLAEVIQDGMDEQGVSGADVLTGESGGQSFVIGPQDGSA